MNIVDIPEVLEASREAKDSVLLIGKHGIGKTESLRNWADSTNTHLEILYLSNQEVGDLIGIPNNKEVNGKLILDWSTPVWLQRLYKAAEEGKKTALFLDEFSRAALDVRQASLQLVLDKKIHQHELPKDTIIIAADNPDNGEYQVETLDPALLDRFLVLDIDLDITSWLDWARENNINEIVRAYIADNPSKLYFEPAEGSESNISATPRSWTKLAAYVDNFSKIPEIAIYNIIKGKIGPALGTQFFSYYKNYTKQVTITDIEDLAKKLKNKNIDIQAEAVKELISDLEVIQKSELTKSLLEKYMKKDSVKEAMPLMAMLYALDLEVLAGVLKKFQSEQENKDENLYLKLGLFDKELNNKALFFKLISYKKNQYN